MDESEIKAQRLHILAQKKEATSYVKQKSALELELSEFLSYLQRPKNISSALPIDIVKFLVWKDGDGRTVVHKTHRKFLGLKGKIVIVLSI